MRCALKAENVTASLVAPRSGKIQTSEGHELQADHHFSTTASVLFDAVFIPGGRQSIDTLANKGDAVHFVREAFKHCKLMAATSEALELLVDLPGISVATTDGDVLCDDGVVTTRVLNTSLGDAIKDAVGLTEGAAASDFTQVFLDALARHRFWGRQKDSVPA